MRTLKVAFRKLRNDVLFSSINIIGLSISLAVCLLIVLFISEQLSYDQFHTKARRIALFRQFEGSAGSGSGFRNLFKNNLAQAEEVTRLLPAKPVITNKANGQSYYEEHFCFADSNFLDVFDLKILQQAQSDPLSVPSGMMISKKLAAKYFPNQEALGKILHFNNEQPLAVTAVFDDLPVNSHIGIEMIVPFASAATLLKQNLDGFWDGQSLTYILASKGTDLESLSDRLPAILRKTADPNAAIWKPALIPLRDIHLRANLDGRVKATGAITEVYVFSAIAGLVLLLACFNYINLSSARAVFKAKEIGVRKIIGAGKLQIALQYLQESGLYVIISAIAGLILASLALPFFNNISGTSLMPEQLYAPGFLLLYFAIVFMLAIITGIIPALSLASLKPLKTAQKKISGGRGGLVLRKVLVTVQFVVSIAIIIAVLTVSRQLNYIQNRDLGYSRAQVATINLPSDVSANAKQDFRERIMQLPEIEAAALSSQIPGKTANNNKLVESFVPTGKDIGYTSLSVDRNFLPLYGIRLLQGTNYTPSSTAANNEFIINQTMAKHLELGENAVGKPLGYYRYQYTQDGGYKEVQVKGKIIGVVADYHQADLKTRITPLLMNLNNGWEGSLSIKLRAGQIQDGITAIEKSWKQSFPDKPFEYDFLENAFNETYKRDRTTAIALSFFAAFAILISCLGLVGLTAITVQRRIKEIGIRKVLGSSALNIAGLVTGDLVILIGLAFLVSVPLAWWAMSRWLEDFAYRINLDWWMFIAAGLLAIIVALITISFQAFRAAATNPIRNLRVE